jgi:hypothetical protein
MSNRTMSPISFFAAMRQRATDHSAPISAIFLRAIEVPVPLMSVRPGPQQAARDLARARDRESARGNLSQARKSEG